MRGVTASFSSKTPPAIAITGTDSCTRPETGRLEPGQNRVPKRIAEARGDRTRQDGKRDALRRR